MTPRFWGTLTGVVLGVVACTVLPGALLSQRQPQQPLALPDSSGHIRSLLLHYSAEADYVLPTYRGLVRHLAPDTQVTVAVPDSSDFSHLARMVEVGPSWAPLVVDRPITGWSRDRFVTAQQGSSPLLVVPRQRVTPVTLRANDWVVPWVFGARAAEPPMVTQAAIHFDGGDFVADEHHIFATALLLSRNDGSPFQDHKQMAAEIKRLFGRDPIIIGERAEDVPDHHIGMFLTPVGHGTVVVGDPRLGERLLGDNGLGADADLSEERIERFARVAQALRDEGFRVRSIPLVPTKSPYVFYSYNNVLIDDRSDGRHVLVPRYGHEPLDSAGAQAWEDLGFQVHQIDASDLYHRGGALRCVASVIERSKPLLAQ